MLMARPSRRSIKEYESAIWLVAHAGRAGLEKLVYGSGKRRRRDFAASGMTNLISISLRFALKSYARATIPRICSISKHHLALNQ